MARTRILIVAAAAVCAAVPALASEPGSGSVSQSSPTTKWTGEVVGPVFTFGSIIQQDATTCVPPSCDQYTLTVKDGGFDMRVNATSEDSSITTLVIERPDGSAVYADGIDPEDKPDNTTSIKMPKVPAGDYTVDVGVDAAATASYRADATLAVPGAQPSPGGPTGPSGPTGPAGTPSATLTLKTTKIRASKKAKLVLAASKPVTSVSAKLSRGSKTVGKAKLAKIDSKATLTFKLRKKLKPGKYVLIASARDGASTVGLRANLKVTR